MLSRLYRWSLPVVLVLCLLALPLLAQDAPQNDLTSFATNTPLADADMPASATPQPDAPATIERDMGEPIVLDLPDACAYVPGEATNQACIDFINANPGPTLQEINADTYTLGQYSFWRVGPSAITTYDAPNGAPIGSIPQGFNFVNAINQVDGWIQSEDGQWISPTDSTYVSATYFRGVRLPDDWRLPFGWILDTTGIYASRVPGGPSDPATGLVPLHYEIFTIYAEAVDDEGWTWYLVGPDQWVKQSYMTVIKPTPRPEGVRGYWVAADLFEQSLVAYHDNRPMFATMMSTGLPGTETNEGLFEVWARLDRDGMSGATGAPNAYALQSVPWVQYFDDGISIHGTYWHDTFGYRRSRGCVNLSISDAKWVYDFLAPENRPQGADAPAYVYIYSTGEYR